MANPAAEPQPVEDIHGDGRWMSLHNSFLHDAKEKEPEVVLIGDSLIAQMTQSRLWEQMFEPLHCLNFGIGGDKTQNILWRIHNGELDKIEPKVIVLLAGTNNFENTADEVTEGLLAIVKLIREKQPSTHIIVVGMLPRGERPNHLREKHSEVNRRLSEELQGAPMTSFIRVDDKEFVSSEGIIRRSVMYDFLHLTSDIGYQKLCDPLLEEIQNVLGIFMKGEGTTLETASLAGDLDHSPSN